jgi:hypothetical protein
VEWGLERELTAKTRSTRRKNIAGKRAKKRKRSSTKNTKKHEEGKNKGRKVEDGAPPQPSPFRKTEMEREFVWKGT